MKEFTKYKREVSKLTNKHNLTVFPNSEKQGRSGIPGSYQLDHKFSIIEGFRQGIAPSIIAHPANLHFIPWNENNAKQGKCSITIDELKIKIKSYEGWPLGES